MGWRSAAEIARTADGIDQRVNDTVWGPGVGKRQTVDGGTSVLPRLRPRDDPRDIGIYTGGVSLGSLRLFLASPGAFFRLSLPLFLFLSFAIALCLSLGSGFRQVIFSVSGLRVPTKLNNPAQKSAPGRRLKVQMTEPGTGSLNDQPPLTPPARLPRYTAASDAAQHSPAHTLPPNNPVRQIQHSPGE